MWITPTYLAFNIGYVVEDYGLKEWITIGPTGWAPARSGAAKSYVSSTFSMKVITPKLEVRLSKSDMRDLSNIIFQRAFISS